MNVISSTLSFPVSESLPFSMNCSVVVSLVVFKGAVTKLTPLKPNEILPEWRYSTGPFSPDFDTIQGLKKEEEDEEEEQSAAVERDRDEDDEEIELEEIEFGGKIYYTDDKYHGELYECLDDGEIGDVVGQLQKGAVFFS